MVPGTTQQARVCGEIRRILGCGLQQVEMACAITELQSGVALSGHRQPHAPSALRHLISRTSYTKERKVMVMAVWGQVKRARLWPLRFPRPWAVALQT